MQQTSDLGEVCCFIGACNHQPYPGEVSYKLNDSGMAPSIGNMLRVELIYAVIVLAITLATVL